MLFAHSSCNPESLAWFLTRLKRAWFILVPIINKKVEIPSSETSSKCVFFKQACVSLVDLFICYLKCDHFYNICLSYFGLHWRLGCEVFGRA